MRLTPSAPETRLLDTVPTTTKALRSSAGAAAFPGISASLADAFQVRSFVQADPIRAPARAQDLILRHRVRGYRSGDLERRYRRLGVEEVYLHAYGFAAPGLSALLHPRFDPNAPDGRHRPVGLEAEVLAFATTRRETHPRDLEAAFGKGTTLNGWGGLSKATTRALDALLHYGHLRVVGRESGTRVYAPTVTATTDINPAGRLLRLALHLVDLLAPVPAATLSALVSGVARSVLGPYGAEAKAAVLRTDALVALEADGTRYVVRAAEDAGPAPSPRRVRFLAPFDPLVWDRRRFEHLWGWPYRFEAYVPEANRKLGYYAMPLSWGDDVIGWVNCRQAGGELDVRAGYVSACERGVRFARQFDEEVARLAAFLTPRGE